MRISIGSHELQEKAHLLLCLVFLVHNKLYKFIPSMIQVMFMDGDRLMTFNFKKYFNFRKTATAI